MGILSGHPAAVEGGGVFVFSTAKAALLFRSGCLHGLARLSGITASQSTPLLGDFYGVIVFESNIGPCLFTIVWACTGVHLSAPRQVKSSSTPHSNKFT